jgi:nitrogen fixation NifU-like protein
MTMSMESMYQQIILDHYKHPQHRGDLQTYDAEVHHVNPTCGDEVTLRVRLDGDMIAELGWVGEGCSISQASTSIMTDLVTHAPIENALQLQESFLALMQSQGHSTLTDAQTDALDDAIAFEGVSKYPARVKCALLGWMAMKAAIAQAQSHDTAEEKI